MATKFNIEERWPELFVQLDETQRRAVVQSLASAWHEGWTPNREDVVDLIDYTRGALTFEDYQARSADKAARIAGAAVVDEHLAFADAALALAGHEVTDPALRAIVESAARHELTGDEAVAAIRRHVQG